MSRALIVVDVQNGFTKIGALASPRCLQAIPRIHAVVAAERAAGSNLFFTADTHAPDDFEFKMFPPHCIAGTEEAEIVDELAEFLGDATMVPKRRYSAFYETDIGDRLAAIRPEVVTVVGVCTDICVLHTVSDLRNRDYEVVVRRDAVETFDAPGHPADEVNRFSLDHMAGILGARIE